MNEETINSSKTARILFSKTSTQEKDLASNLKKRNPGDKSITQLRNEIRDNYEKIIFLDMEFAASKDVDQLLWKSVFYKAIEEFRKIIKKYQSNTDANKAATVKEKLQKTFVAFAAFLTESVAYFEALQAKLGQVKIDKDEDKFKQIQAAMMHKCFIILGDLSRYQQLYTDTLTKNWTIASNYYHKALELMPSSGNAQNQLAVIATYAEDEFEAVYRYFRSLAVAKPFISARENLLLLFEQSRLRYIKIFGKQQKSNMPKAFKKNKKAVAQPSKNNPQIRKQLVEKFLLRFVRLHGIIFSKIGLELFDELQEETGKDLEDVLKGQLLSEAALLKIVIMCIFAIENATKNAKELASYTMSFVFSILTSMTRVASTIPSHTLGAVTVFLRYAALHTATFVQYRRDGQSFWVAIANMLNSLPKAGGVKQNGPLEEDAELLGFAPVQAFETSSTPVAAQDVPVIRIKRATDAALAIAKVENMNFLFENDTFMALEDDDDENLNGHAKNTIYDFVDDSEQTAFAEDDNEVPVDVEQAFVGANFAMQNEDDMLDNLDGAEDVIDMMEHNGSVTTTTMPAMAHSYASNSAKVIGSPSRYQDSQGGLFSTSSYFAQPPVQQDNYFGHQWYGNGNPQQQQDGYGRTIKRPDTNTTQPMTNAGFATWGNAPNTASFAQPFGAYHQQQQPQAYPFFSNAPQNGYQQKKSFIS